MRGVRTRMWGYSNFTGHGFVGRHRFEGEDTDLSLTYIYIYIYTSEN
jgi:hypothetical protein